MNYYYSQKYGAYKNYGIGTPTMYGAGCVITGLAMILSYFNDRPFYPEQMLSWGRENGMLTDRGYTRFDVFPKATNNKLRISDTNTASEGEVTYAIRECVLDSGLKHWVIDHPIESGKIIDTWNGVVYDFKSKKYKYTGRVNYYIGKK